MKLLGFVLASRGAILLMLCVHPALKHGHGPDEHLNPDEIRIQTYALRTPACFANCGVPIDATVGQNLGWSICPAVLAKMSVPKVGIGR